VTRLRAHRVDAVKVSPDWRHIVFVARLANDIGNLYAVAADAEDAEQAVPLLGEQQLDALDSQCQLHSKEVLKAAGLAGGGGQGRGADALTVARLNGYKHLQVIIPGMPALTPGGDVDEASVPAPSEGTSPWYRAAFAFECVEPGDAPDLPPAGPGLTPLRFSKLAMVDFQLLGLNLTHSMDPTRSAAYARSELKIVDAVPVAPEGASSEVRKAVARYTSQACPRFVPSKRGNELLFVAEDLDPAQRSSQPSPTAWLSPALQPARRLALASVPEEVGRAPRRRLPETRDKNQNVIICCAAFTAPCLACAEGQSVDEYCLSPGSAAVPGCEGAEAPGKELQACCTERRARCLACYEGKSVEQFCAESGKHMGVAGCEEDVQDISALQPLEFQAIRAEAALVDVGQGALPYAPVRGCPEFVPRPYFETESLAAAFTGNIFRTPGEEAAAELEEQRARDTFAVLTDPSSASVLGVDAQVLAVALPEGPGTGAVSRVQLLYNVGASPGGPFGPAGQQLRLGGCQPIRAAGRTSHMRLQSVLETLMLTLQLRSMKSGLVTWLACLTADQRVAIVQSSERDHWINMSMPYPLHTGQATQGVWCPEERQEACFEVWSNPNPNE